MNHLHPEKKNTEKQPFQAIHTLPVYSVYFSPSLCNPLMTLTFSRRKKKLVAALEPHFFPFSWEFHCPNWLSYFSDGWLNHQPEKTHQSAAWLAWNDDSVAKITAKRSCAESSGVEGLVAKRYPTIVCWWMFIPQTGWWFGRVFIFPYIGHSNPNWLSWISGRLKTTNH